MNRRLRKSDFDIIHSIGPNTFRANVVTIQNIQPAKMVILKRHAGQEKISPLRRLTRQLYLQTTSAAERKLYTRKPAPMFLPVSRGVEAELRRHYDIGDAKVRIVPNAADTAVFHPIKEPEREAWRVAQGFHSDDFIAIFSGGEWARKGLDLALRALGLVRQPELKLFVAGDDPDRERFRALAAEAGVKDRVVFGGFRQDMATALAASDFFLFPSYYEAFSLATIEAAACGLPVIAAKINGTEDFIEPGMNGEFISHDPAAIAAVLSSLCANKQVVREMGDNARQMVEGKYTWDHVTSATENAYRDFLS